MSRLASVLLIDPDSKGLATLTFGFVREGARVMGASNYRDGIKRAHAEAHDVVVVALRDDTPDEIREVLEELAERDGKPIPLVGVGLETHRTLVGAMPTADFLPMPSFIRDIITTAKLRAALRADATDEAPTLVEGALSDFGVFSLLRSLQAAGRSAIVQLDRANRRGELRFSKGELTFAQVGPNQGLGALNLLLLWEEAALQVRFKTVAKRGQMSIKGAELLEQSERFMRDFVAAARDLGSAQTVYSVREDAGTEVAAELAPVLRLFDGTRSLADVIDDSPFQVFDTLRVVTRFIDGKRLHAGPEARAKAGAGVRSPLLEDWLRTPGEDEFVRPVGHVVAMPLSGPEEKPATVARPAARDAGETGAPADAAGARLHQTQPLTPLAADSREAGEAIPAAIAQDAPTIPSSAPVPAPVSAPVPVALGSSVGASGTFVSSASAPRKIVNRSPSVVVSIQVEDQQDAAPPAPSQPEPKPEPKMEQPAAAATSGEPSRKSVRPSGAFVVPAQRPARRQSDIPKAGSIEIAPEMLAEMDSFEMRNAPATPLPPPPAAAPAAAPPAAADVSARPAARPRTPSNRTRKPSSDFDALEKDFFAREADLYKKEDVEDFSDLDQNVRRK